VSLLPRCRSCGRDLDRRMRESNKAFRGRRICSMTECTGQGTIKPDYPGAVPLASAGDRCRRCGGPYRRVEGGLGCVLCGRMVHVIEILASRNTCPPAGASLFA
jgi:hypothetical protein